MPGAPRHHRDAVRGDRTASRARDRRGERARGRPRRRRRRARCPAVVTNSPSALPARPPSCRRSPSATPARSHASAIGGHHAPEDLEIGSPSSRISAADRNERPAPIIARSFTVPLTASSPMFEPGKNVGVTTNASVVNARRVPFDLDDGRVAQARELGAAEHRDEQVADQLLRELAAARRGRAGPCSPGGSGTGHGARTRRTLLASLTPAPPRGAGRPGSRRRTRPRSRPSARRAGARACRACRTPGTRAGFARPRSTSPAMQISRLARPGRRRRAGTAPRRRGPRSGSRSRSPLCGITPMPAPRAVARSRRPRRRRAAPPRCRRGRTARDVLVLDLGRPSSSCVTSHQDALEQVDRLEPGDDDRHAVVARDRLVLAPAHRSRRRGRARGTPARGSPGETRIAVIAGGTSTCATSSAKFSMPSVVRLLHRHRVRRRGRLEADREEHDRACRGCAARSRARRAASTRRGRRRPPRAP